MIEKRVSDETIAQMTDALEPKVLCDYVALDLRDARAEIARLEQERMSLLEDMDREIGNSAAAKGHQRRLQRERDAALACVAEMGRGIEEAVCNTPSRPGTERWLAMIGRAKEVYGGDFPPLDAEGQQ